MHTSSAVLFVSHHTKQALHVCSVVVVCRSVYLLRCAVEYVQHLAIHRFAHLFHVGHLGRQLQLLVGQRTQVARVNTWQTLQCVNLNGCIVRHAVETVVSFHKTRLKQRIAAYR